MNILNREDLNDYTTTRTGDNIVRKSNFTDIQRFLSVGFSTIFTATSQVNCNNGIQPSDKVYFKINNEFGVNAIGRVDESSGSCEDVAEVLGFYALRNLGKVLGKNGVLKTTPYEFAEYSHETFFDAVLKKTGGFIESDRMYGCISKNCVAPEAEIIHGDSMLSLVVPNNKITKSSSNTLYNYDTSLGQFALEAGLRGQELLVHPITTRFLANTMFWDYFFANSDRHCKNINFQKVPLGNNKFLVEPLAVIDNGGGLCMQSSNCKKLFTSCEGLIANNGLNSSHIDNSFNPFSVPYDFYAGAESYPDGELKDLYDALRYREQLVVLLSTNKELYSDFANMYKNLDFATAVEDMHTELLFNPNFLPNLSAVATTVLQIKRAEISESMANYMGESFNIETFNANPSYYLDKFAEFVQDNSSNLHIATNEEVASFNETLYNEYGYISQHNMSENLPQVSQTQQMSAEEISEYLEQELDSFGKVDTLDAQQEAESIKTEEIFDGDTPQDSSSKDLTIDPFKLTEGLPEQPPVEQN